jgi:hypothetical protein
VYSPRWFGKVPLRSLTLLRDIYKSNILEDKVKRQGKGAHLYGCVAIWTGLHRSIFLFLWTGVKVGKEIIEGKIDGHNIPKLLQNNKALYFLLGDKAYKPTEDIYYTKVG